MAKPVHHLSPPPLPEVAPYRPQPPRESGPAGYAVCDLDKASTDDLRRLWLVYKRLAEFAEREMRSRIAAERGEAKMAAVLRRVNDEVHIQLPVWARW